MHTFDCWVQDEKAAAVALIILMWLFQGVEDCGLIIDFNPNKDKIVILPHTE